MQVEREQLGNAADEQGVAGADFAGMNRAELPEGRPDPIEVEAEYLAGDGLTLTPAIGEDYPVHGFVLHEGPLDLLSAQLCEEPEDPEAMGLKVWRQNGIEVEANSRRLAEVTRRSPREELVWYGMHPEYYGAASGDRVILRRDVMESQYSCKLCRGIGFEDGVLCANCGGNGTETVTSNPTPQSPLPQSQQVPCRACRVTGFQRETAYSCGRKKCSRCHGSGWKGGIVIPEESQTQAITGVVVSVGPDVTLWKIGDRLVFSRYAGHTLSVSKSEDFIWMHEKEPIGILRQRGEKA